MLILVWFLLWFTVRFKEYWVQAASEEEKFESIIPVFPLRCRRKQRKGTYEKCSIFHCAPETEGGIFLT